MFSFFNYQKWKLALTNEIEKETEKKRLKFKKVSSYD